MRSLSYLLRGGAPGPWAVPGGELTTAPGTPRTLSRAGLEDAISAAIAERSAAFSLADALELPSVIRARELLMSAGAQMVPQVVRDAFALPDQHRIVRRPDPFSTREAFVARTIAGLVDHGESFWRIGEADQDGFARYAVVLAHAEVQVAWDERRWQRRYTWRGQELIHGRDILHVANDLGPSDLHGHGPLSPDRGLPALAIVYAAELYAQSFYGSGGIPQTVLKTAARLTSIEAADLAQQWADARARGQLAGKPAVAAGGVDVVFPGTDPEKSQLQATRDYGNTITARLLGIPAALLHVATSGATITYVSAQGAMDELVKATLVPSYLVPIEAHWSDLVPRTSAVRFALGELNRSDVATRWAVYTQAHAMDALSAEEVRRLEGWGDMVNVAAMAPTPAVAPGDLTHAEVPAP